MRKTIRVNRVTEENGMALVLTLMAVSFLVAITVQLTSSVNWQMQGAGNLRDSVQLDAMNRSGLSLVRASLAADFKENEYDSEFDSWKKLEKDGVPGVFGQGKLELKVTDLSGLLQVNALVPDKTRNRQEFTEKQNKQISLWKRFLTSGKFDIDDDEVDELIDAIIDWIDEDDNEEDNGAEKGYYLSLSPSYEAGNAPIAYLEELLHIRGMTKELFYGIDEYLPLANFLTVAGRDGKININSAPLEVLMVLNDTISSNEASDLIEFRENEDHKEKLENPQWYKQVNSSLDLGRDFVEIKSQYFKVSVVAKHNKLKRSGTGILERNRDNGTQKLLYWEVR